MRRALLVLVVVIGCGGVDERLEGIVECKQPMVECPAGERCEVPPAICRVVEVAR